MRLDLDPEKERRIVRMTALRAAVDFIGGSTSRSTADIKRAAASFEAWIYRNEEEEE